SVRLIVGHALFFSVASCVAAIACGGMLALFADAPLVGGALAVAGFGPLFWTIDQKLNPGLFGGPASYAFFYPLLGYAVGPLGQHYFSIEPQRFSTRGMEQAQWGAILGLLLLAALYPPVFRLGERLAKPNPGSELRPGDTRWTGYTTFLALTALVILVF